MIDGVMAFVAGVGGGSVDVEGGGRMHGCTGVDRYRRVVALNIWWLETSMDKARNLKKKKKRAPRGRKQVQRAIREKKEDALQATVEMILRSAMENNLSKARSGLDTLKTLEMYPSLSTYNQMLSWLAKISGTIDVEKVFAEMTLREVAPNLVTFSILLRTYGLAGDVGGVRKTFSRLMQQGPEPDGKTYAKVVNYCARNGDVQGLNWVIDHMKRRAPAPDAHTYAALIKASAVNEELEQVERLYLEMTEEHHFTPTLDIYNSRIFAHGKAGDVETAEKVLQQMRSNGVQPNQSTFTALIRSYVSVGDLRRASKTLHRMKAARLTPTSATIGILMSAYRKTDDVEAALALFRDAQARKVRLNQKTFQSLMSVQSRNGHVAGAFETFGRYLQEEFPVTVATYASLFSPFIETARGPFQHPEQVAESLEPGSELHHSALLDAYLRTDDLGAARDLIDLMRRREIDLGIATFNALVEWFTRHRLIDHAMRVMEEAEDLGIDPDVRSFQALLGLQTRAGDIEGALQTIKWMRRFDIPPVRRMYRSVFDAFSQDPNFAAVLEALEVSRRRIADAHEDKDLKKQKKLRGLVVDAERVEDEDDDLDAAERRDIDIDVDDDDDEDRSTDREGHRDDDSADDVYCDEIEVGQREDVDEDESYDDVVDYTDLILDGDEDDEEVDQDVHDGGVEEESIQVDRAEEEQERLEALAREKLALKYNLLVRRLPTDEDLQSALLPNETAN